MNNNILWLYQYIDSFDQNNLHFIKKLGVATDFSYIIWNKEFFPLHYISSYKKTISYNYPNKIGPQNVKMIEYIFKTDGKTLTLVKFNHFKKGFVLDHIRFSNIEFRDL